MCPKNPELKGPLFGVWGSPGNRGVANSLQKDTSAECLETPPSFWRRVPRGVVVRDIPKESVQHVDFCRLEGSKISYLLKVLLVPLGSPNSERTCVGVRSSLSAPLATSGALRAAEGRSSASGSVGTFNRGLGQARASTVDRDPAFHHTPNKTEERGAIDKKLFDRFRTSSDFPSFVKSS